MNYPILLTLAMSLPVLVSSHYYHNNNKLKSSEQCDCQCSGLLTDGHTRDLTFCQKLLWLEKEFKSLKQGLESRTQHIKELKDLQERVSIQEDYVETLQNDVKELQKELKSKENYLPTPEALVMRPDDQMLGDHGQDARLTDTDLAKNVSDLLAKVEKVENRTSQVQEELRSERRVRRHLEEDLNETRYSIRLLDDKLHNVSVSRDVEEVFLSTLENMNKTFFEDHLQKLYYKVDGVVYKNETKELDKRLDQVESELQEVNNNTALQMVTLELQALAEEINALRNLSQAVTEGLVSEDLRIDVLENKTQNFEDVEEQLKTLKNVSNVIQEGAIQFKIDVMDVRNKTKELEDALLQQVNYSSYLNDTLKSVMNDASDEISQLKSVMNNASGEISHFKSVMNKASDEISQLKSVMNNESDEISRLKSVMNNESDEISQLKSVMNNASGEISELKSELNKSLDLHLELEKELKFVAADVAMVENRVHDLSLSSEIKIQDVYRKIDNVTDSMENSIHSLAAILIEMNTKPSIDDAEHETNDLTTNDESSLKGFTESPCTLPTLNDTHLLVSMEENDEGQQELEFACRPIGRYVLDRPSVPLRCEDGQWNGPMPSCLKLLDEKEMEDVSKELKSKNPCLSSSGDSPDPTDCFYFFKCWMGRSERFSCPSMLHFDKITKRCDYPRVANCKPHVTEETALIVNVTPVVKVDPDNIDKPYGLMGTSDSGHLVVYPRTRFSLNCIFPSNRWGPPKWRVDLFLPNSSKEIQTKNEQNSVRMTVIADSEEDSGVYSCESPFGKQNSITIVVQAVTCPTVPWSDGIGDIVYRPNPDGLYRALTTPVEYVCSSGAKVKGYCMADGKWSVPPPTPEECQSEEFVRQTLWGCPFLHTEGHPNLVLERNDHDTTITFKCAGNTNLIGSTFTRCYHGNWTHRAMPRCIPKKRTWN